MYFEARVIDSERTLGQRLVKMRSAGNLLRGQGPLGREHKGLRAANGDRLVESRKANAKATIGSIPFDANRS